MDSVQRRFLLALREYLDDINGRQRLPIDNQLAENLNNIERELSQSPEVDLSPGKQVAAEASGSIYERVQYDPTDELTPGQKASIGVE